MSALVLGSAGLVGLAVGSFLNVVIHRVPRGESLVSPPSTCVACGHEIGWRDNIPVLSFLMLRGRCRSCRARISVRYPIIELANAVLWMGAATRFENIEEAVFVALVTSALLVLSAIDLEVRRIPNVIVVPGVAFVLVWLTGSFAVHGDLPGLFEAFVSGIGAFLILFAIAMISGGMGFGDVKLAAFVGLITGRFGWEVTVVAILGAFVTGGVVALVLLATKRVGRKDAIPFGPSLALAATIALFGGPGLASSWLGLF